MFYTKLTQQLLDISGLVDLDRFLVMILDNLHT